MTDEGYEEIPEITEDDLRRIDEMLAEGPDPDGGLNPQLTDWMRTLGIQVDQGETFERGGRTWHFAQIKHKGETHRMVTDSGDFGTFISETPGPGDLPENLVPKPNEPVERVLDGVDRDSDLAKRLNNRPKES